AHPHVEIHEGVGGPELLPELLARHDVARVREEQEEDLERLVGEPGLQALLAQLARLDIQLEGSEANDPLSLVEGCHHQPASLCPTVCPRPGIGSKPRSCASISAITDDYCRPLDASHAR